MLERMTLNLSTQERMALEAMAAVEMRNIREQARFIIREELTRRGLLIEDAPTIQPAHDAQPAVMA